MRVYTRIVSDWNGNILESECHEYDGIVSECKGGGSPPPPPQPTKEERALQRQQTELLKEQTSILKEQLRQQNLVAPFLFEEAGLIAQFEDVTDPDTGEITQRLAGFERSDDPTRQLREEIELGFLERSQRALEGDLPVSPGLERQLGEAEADLREQLRRQLGPGFETSSPGIEALATQAQRAEELREGARRGELTLAEQFSLSRQQANQASNLGFIGSVQDVVRGPLAGISALQGTTQGFGDIASRLAQDRQSRASIANQQFLAQQQASAGTFGSIFGALGSIGGGLAAGGFFSSKRFKNKLDELNTASALNAINNMPVDIWQYKDGLADNKIHVGTYAEDFSKHTGLGDGVRIEMVDAVGVLMAAVQELSAEVKRLKEERDV